MCGNMCAVEKMGIMIMNYNFCFVLSDAARSRDADSLSRSADGRVGMCDSQSVGHLDALQGRGGGGYLCRGELRFD